MDVSEKGLLNLVITLARMLEIDPMTLGTWFLQYDKNQEYLETLLLITGKPEK